ncbi:glycerophosphodiester phosphodiesterase family protein [Aliiglaciecola sp. 2_MG-2023]|uniref:glycerophosphodiester phosphodiesterase n=1 Tax=unclassified Aliiglaciecola TaxID=2593648 RepID=UPI0026E17F84|nr:MULTISPECIES: glycerophosphodiester phosphodiesterase family protein [unclassified Aliiglaciecola]MDO6709685.1 glycerophosphodiester phosphodiesterase family protein [Aliiglaciecola sp. 2_MG-2023]MDO6750773.1 glycerophosphodiester phosphodiesterase family protein [Aliiglaciecola sp. 1_MG-2023]
MFIYAHRGASALAPENTLLALKTAISQQADGIEFDVFQHQNEFILIHDRWLHRTTNGIGNIDSLLLEQIRKLDAGEGETVPTLFEALECIGQSCQINIELKGVRDIPLLLKYVQQACIALSIPCSNILYSSFDHHLLKAIKTISPTSRIGALTANKPVDYAAFAENLGAEFVNADVTFVDKNFVYDAKRRGLKMGVYTVDQPEDLLQLQKWGVDAVFCNNPLNARLALTDSAVD